MADTLRALVLGVWQLLSVHSVDAPRIADAIVAAVVSESEQAPSLGRSHADDAVALAVWAAHESQARLEPVPESWDAKALVSCGPWQIPCALARRYTLAGQARYWLYLARLGYRDCPEHPAAPLSSGSCARGRRLSDTRLSEARSLLAAWVSPGEE